MSAGKRGKEKGPWFKGRKKILCNYLFSMKGFFHENTSISEFPVFAVFSLPCDHFLNLYKHGSCSTSPKNALCPQILFMGRGSEFSLFLPFDYLFIALIQHIGKDLGF